jgi:DNA-binding GntR family transcriptional regulator
MTRSTTKNAVGEHGTAGAHPRHATSRRVIRLVPRREVTSSAYQRLRDLIVAGRLAPGAPLVETELSARLSVSRTPVRAALQRLQQEGFVSASRAGTMLRAAVAPLTAEDMREVFLMVGALESAAARMAAGLEPASRQALADEMARLADQLHAASSSRPPDIVRAHELHVRFHRLCTAAGAGPRLLAELDVLQPQAERYERVYASAIVHAFDEASREHAAIVEALRDGDGVGVERAVQRNWRGSAERYGQVVTILGERGNW